MIKHLIYWTNLIMDPFHFKTIENDIQEHGWVLDHLFDDLEVGLLLKVDKIFRTKQTC